MRILRRKTLSFLFRMRMRAQIDERNHYLRGRWMDDLDRLIAVPEKSGAPGLMPADDFRETAFQSCMIESPVATNRDRLVVNQSVTRQLRVNPDLLLTIGEGNRTGSIPLRNGGRLGVRPSHSAAEVSF
jgi:hypothetical protein